MSYYIFPFIFAAFFIMKITIQRSGRNPKASRQTLLEKETQANMTRRQNIDHLPYIQIPMEQLPFGKLDTPKSLDSEKRLRHLATTQILNLNGMTNTDLKLQYGPANLDVLSQCDEHYIELVRTLHAWGKELLDANLTDDAQTVLEYSVEIGSDVRGTYQLLADIYVSHHQKDKLLHLEQMSLKLTSLPAPAIQAYVKEALNQLETTN